MKLAIACVVLCLGVISCGPSDYKKFTSDPIVYSKTVKRLNDIVL